MFNAGVRGKRAKDTTGLITVGEHFNQQQFLIPTVTRFAVTDGSYVDTNDTAADTVGGQTIVLYGSGFAPGATVLVGSTTIGVVTFLDSGRLTFSSPALGSGSYTVFVTNANGGTGILVPGLVYSGVPTFTTAAGSLGNVYETTAINTTVVATGDEPITYALSSGSLPSGSTLSSGGTISGTAPVDGSSTTYSFTIQASDAQNQDSIRSFSLTINTDVVSFSSPANNTSYNLTQNFNISNVTVTATSAAGYGVLYTSSGLPTGLSMNTSTGIISGTPTILASNASIITATANTTNRTAALYLNWSINLPGDLFWKYASLLLSANSAPNGNTFNTDLSTINNEVVVTGDIRPSEFHPFKEGYYSNNFDGTGDYLSSNNTGYAFGTGDFTIESWIYRTDTGVQRAIVDTRGGASNVGVLFYITTNNKLNLFDGTTTWLSSNNTISANQWVHVAAARSSGTTKLFINGTQEASGADAKTYTSGPSGLYIGRQFGSTTNDWAGFISNLRIIKGNALYTANNTPSTTPLTYVANTILLTCQSNKLIDNSNNNSTITKNGDTRVSPFVPFDGTPKTFTVPGANNYSMYFDGTGDYLTVPSNANLNFGTGSFTVEFWWYPASIATDQGFLGGDSGSYDFCWRTSTGFNIGRIATAFDNQFAFTPAVNTWYHVAYCRSGTSIRVFVNGTQVGTTITNSNSYNTNGNGLIVGGSTASARLMTGYISNLRIIKGTALYTGSTLPVPTEPLTAIANTSLLTCQANTVIDKSTNAFTITTTGNAGPSRNGPFANTTTVDLVGNEGSAYFDGTGDYLSIANNSDFSLSARSYTIEFWVYWNNLSGEQVLVERFSAPSGPGYTFYKNGSNQISLYGSSTVVTGTTVVTTNTWYHIALSYNGTTTRLFVNGTLDASANANLTDGGTSLIIGSRTGASAFFNGYMSNLRIVKGTALYTTPFVPTWAPLTPVANTVLLTTQTNSSSNTKVFVDESNFNNIITPTGNTALGTFTPFGSTWSAYFDGSGDYLSIASNAAFGFGTGDFTVEYWVYSNSWAASPTVVELRSSGVGLQFSDNYTTGGAPGVYYNSTQQLTSSITIPTNTWAHVAFTRSGTTMKIWVNGVEGASGTKADNLQSTGTPRIGTNNNNANPFTGYISNVRILKGTALYTSAFTPSTTSLTAIANTTLLTCQSNKFVDNSTANSGVGFTVTRTGDTYISKFSPFSNIVNNLPENYSANTYGSSIFFDTYVAASVDYLSVSGIPISTTGQFTLEVWIYVLQVNNADNQIIYSQYTTSDANRWTLNISTANKLVVSHPSVSVTGATTIVPYQWNHVAVTRDANNTLRLFLNGVIDASSASYTYSIQQSAPRVGYFNNTPNDYFNGYMSSFRVVNGQALYTTAFVPSNQPLPSTANTRLLLASTVSPSVTDATGNHNIETFGTARRVANNSPYYDTYSAYFDGTGDYLTITSNAALAVGTADFTIECWVYPQTTTQFTVLFLTGTFQLFVLNGALYWNDGTQTSGGTIVLNTWQHIAVSRSGTALRGFVNGVQVITTTSSVNLSQGTNYIGYNGSGVGRGFISNLRLNKDTALYTGNFTPSTTSLTAIANTALLTCQSNRFIDNSNNALTITKTGDVKVSTLQPFVANNTSRFSSVYFPAKTDYLAIRPQENIIIFSGDFTFECWVYPTLTTTTTWGIWDSRNTAGSANPMVFTLDPLASAVAGSYRMSYYNGTKYYGTTTVLWNQWTHVAWVRSGTTMTFYVNGVAGGTATISGTQTGNATGGPIYIGSKDNASAGYGTNGYIADLRITNGYARTITIPTAPYDIK